MNLSNVSPGVRACGLGAALLASSTATVAAPIVFDFVGPTLGSRDSLTFEQAGLTLTVRGTNVTTGAAGKVSQWEYGLGVRTLFPNTGDGDGALDSIGDDELLELSFTDAGGQPVTVELDTVGLHAFGDGDDLTLWVDGVVVLGPDHHPQSASWDPSDSVSPDALQGARFGLSVSDEPQDVEDDYFRISSVTVLHGPVQEPAFFRSSAVPEPGTWSLLALALGLLAAGGVRRHARPATTTP